MPYDLTNPLVIGISSRALFNLEAENKIFEEYGLETYEEYQVQHENDILQKGSAFQLVKAFLGLNKLLPEKRFVEVIVMSRNSPNTSLRIFNSISDYELDITRAALSGGSPIAPYFPVHFCEQKTKKSAPEKCGKSLIIKEKREIFHLPFSWSE